ncbi:MAG TPA: hypothetical protein VGH77_13535 [Streptosporangiaceae bacterium]
MITRTKLVIGTFAAGLALAGCGSVAGTSGQGSHGKPFVQHQVQRSGSSVDEARGGLGGTRPALSPDSGLAGCSSVLGAHQVAASEYPKIAAQFAGSRWPDLRISGLAYVEIATRLHATHAYGGETAWFIERLAAACAKHGPAGNSFAI